MNKNENPYFLRLSSQRARLWNARQPLLSHLDVELTERCNNNCVHCCINLPADDASARKRELSTEAVKHILEEAASLGCLSVRFTGGEPLLREDFEELYGYARKKGLRVTLFTNATLLTPSLANLLSRIPPLEEIEVSVYGMKKETYEAVTRTPGSFEGAWRGIRLLLENKIPFVVKSALLPASRGDVEALEAWASTIPWMHDPPRYAIFFDLHSRRDEKKNDLIRRLRPTPEQGMEFILRRKATYLKEMKRFCAGFLGPSGPELFSCGAGMGGACLDAYGQLQLCMDLRHPDTLYDLEKGTLKGAMTEFFPAVRERKATHPEYLARCARCFLIGLCEQCPGKSWTEHGTLDTPVEYVCEVAHAQARYLGLLRGKESAWEIKDWGQRIGQFMEEKDES